MKECDPYDLCELGVVGDDVRISPNVSITRPKRVRLGSHVAIDPWFYCTTALETGDYVHISSHVAIIGGELGMLKMRHFTNISAHGTVVCVSDTFDGSGLVTAPGIPVEFLNGYDSGPVVFENFVNTGVNVTIFPDVILPEGVVIGACSLVRKKDILKPWTIYAGNPLRKIRDRPRELMLRHAKKLGY